MEEKRKSGKMVGINGIEVTVIMGEKTFDLYITIGAKADITTKHKNDAFTLKFRQTNKGKNLERPITLIKKDIKYFQGAASNNIKVMFKTEDYKCEISLSPKLYVSEEVLKAEEEKKLKRTKSEKVQTNSSTKAKIRNFRPIFYTKNNIARPYRGGRCSPKWTKPSGT